MQFKKKKGKNKSRATLLSAKLQLWLVLGIRITKCAQSAFRITLPIQLKVTRAPQVFCRLLSMFPGAQCVLSVCTLLSAFPGVLNVCGLLSAFPGAQGVLSVCMLLSAFPGAQGVLSICRSLSVFPGAQDVLSACRLLSAFPGAQGVLRNLSSKIW